jgi:hypothetical protein
MYMIVLSHSAARENTANQFKAFHCTMDIGMRVYTGEVREGILTERVESTSMGPWTLTPQKAVRPVSNDEVTDYYWTLKINTSGSERQVELDSADWRAMVASFNDYFTCANFIDDDSDCAFSQIADTITQSEFYYWTPGVNAFFGSLAEALSVYFHTATGETVSGTTERLEQFVHVRWPWLAVQLIMVVLNTVFVLAVRLQSHRLGLPSWRNSALALVMTERAREEDDVLGHKGERLVSIGPSGRFEKVSDLEAWARQRNVTLDHKWRKGLDGSRSGSSR